MREDFVSLLENFMRVAQKGNQQEIDAFLDINSWKFDELFSDYPINIPKKGMLANFLNFKNSIIAFLSLWPVYIFIHEVGHLLGDKLSLLLNKKNYLKAGVSEEEFARVFQEYTIKLGPGSAEGYILSPGAYVSSQFNIETTLSNYSGGSVTFKKDGHIITVSKLYDIKSSDKLSDKLHYNVHIGPAGKIITVKGDADGVYYYINKDYAKENGIDVNSPEEVRSFFRRVLGDVDVKGLDFKLVDAPLFAQFEDFRHLFMDVGGPFVEQFFCLSLIFLMYRFRRLRSPLFLMVLSGQLNLLAYMLLSFKGGYGDFYNISNSLSSYVGGGLSPALVFSFFTVTSLALILGAFDVVLRGGGLSVRSRQIIRGLGFRNNVLIRNLADSVHGSLFKNVFSGVLVNGEDGLSLLDHGWRGFDDCYFGILEGFVFRTLHFNEGGSRKLVERYDRQVRLNCKKLFNVVSKLSKRFVKKGGLVDSDSVVMSVKDVKDRLRFHTPMVKSNLTDAVEEWSFEEFLDSYSRRLAKFRGVFDLFDFLKNAWIDDGGLFFFLTLLYLGVCKGDRLSFVDDDLFFDIKQFLLFNHAKIKVRSIIFIGILEFYLKVSHHTRIMSGKFKESFEKNKNNKF